MANFPQHEFHAAILNWYDKCGRLSLPWRNQISDYRIWLSEVMLQQTQVKTVLNYFHRFLNEFPTIKELALAERDNVLALWSGLGYYTRAKNLHITAQLVHHEYQGSFPTCATELQNLPGIGKSTAHAILAISHDLPFAILDGNVKRVLARLYAVNSPINEAKTIKQLWKLTESLVPSQRPRDYTQAMMDIGALICTRTKPKCNQCPIQQYCQSYQQDLTHKLPIKTKRKAIPTKHTAYAFMVNQQGQLFLQRRPDKGLWAGLWQCPEVKAQSEEPFFKLKHTFSHFHLEMTFYRKLADNLPQNIDGEWFDKQRLQQIGIPAPFSQLIEKYFMPI